MPTKNPKTTFIFYVETLTLEMEDPFAYLTKYSTISESQAEYLRLQDFELEDLSLQENSSASESTPLDPIIICSLPMDEEEASSAMQHEEECFQTPEENLSTQDPDEQKIDGIGGGLGGGESSVAVDLDRDTDLLFSDGNMFSDKVVLTEIVDETEVLRSEMSKNEFLVGESSSIGELGLLNSRKLDFDLNDIPDDSVGVKGDVEEPRDEETEEVHVFSGDVEMDISPLVPGIHNSGTLMVDSEPGENVEFPENSQPEDHEKKLENEMSNAIGNMEVQDKFEINDSNGGTANGASQGVRKLPDWISEFAQREEGPGEIRSGSGDDLNANRESEEQRLTGAGSSSQGQANLARGGRGLGRGGRRGGRRNRLNSGREERNLTGAQGPEMRQEANAPSANVTGVTRNSSGGSATQAYVKLSDLVNCDDNDILAVAIKAGMKIPRPRWWRPEGYGPGTSQPLISRLLDYSQAVAEGKIH